METLLLWTLLFFPSSPAAPQKAADFDAKYQPIRSYAVRPDVLMIPKYTADGDVCELVLEPKHETPEGIQLGVFLSDALVQQLFDELVPDSEKGKKVPGFYVFGNTGSVNGSTTNIEYRYENVILELYGTVRPKPAGNVVAVIKWTHRKCQQKRESDR